jgi:hypothetical protein
VPDCCWLKSGDSCGVRPLGPSQTKGVCSVSCSCRSISLSLSLSLSHTHTHTQQSWFSTAYLLSALTSMRLSSALSTLVPLVNEEALESFPLHCGFWLRSRSPPTPCNPLRQLTFTALPPPAQAQPSLRRTAVETGRWS